MIGAPSINSVTENSRSAKAVSRAYDPCRLALLRSYFWNFAIKRAQLVASATPPLFGRTNAFLVPGDFLMLAPLDQLYAFSGGGQISGPSQIKDWQIEGNQIITDDPSPLMIRYISSDLTENLFDVSFAEALSADIAFNIAEEMTQSNAKVQNAGKMYDDAIKMARQRNAFENRPTQPPTDSYINVRI